MRLLPLAAAFLMSHAVMPCSGVAQVAQVASLPQEFGGQPPPVQLSAQSLEGEQIRVTIQFLMVDSETRDEIYRILDPTQIERGEQIPAGDQGPLASSRESSDQALSHLPDSAMQPARKFVSPSHVTTAVLDESQRGQLVRLTSTSKQCNLSNAPSVILLQYREAELNDLVQHPMVVAVRKLNEELQPVVRVFEDGIRMRMVANLTEATTGPAGPPIQFACEVQVSELIKIETEKVYGLSEQPLTVQVPLHRTTLTSLKKTIEPEQTILIDPHQSRTRIDAAPVSSKLSYLNRLKKNNDKIETRQNLLILMRLDIE